MKKLLFAAAIVLFAFPAYAQVTKGALCRLSSVDCAKTWTFDDVTTGDLTATTTIDTGGITYSDTIAGNPATHCKVETVNAAGLLAGTTLLTGESGKSIRLHYLQAFVNGATDGPGTDTLTLEDSSAGVSDDPVLSIAVGALTDQAVLYTGTSGWTKRSSYMLGSGGSLTAASTGSTEDFGSFTSIEYNFCYTYQ